MYLMLIGVRWGWHYLKNYLSFVQPMPAWIIMDFKLLMMICR